jgi:hypothetical protein
MDHVRRQGGFEDKLKMSILQNPTLYAMISVFCDILPKV